MISWGDPCAAWLVGALNSHSEIFCLKAGNEALSDFEPCVRLEGVDYAWFLDRAGIGYRASGDVDGFSHHDLPEVRDRFGPGFTAAVLVRDPETTLIERLASGDRSRWARDLRLMGAPQQVDDLVLPDADPQTQLFVQAVHSLNSIVWGHEIGPFFKAEDVVDSPEALAGLVAYLTGGRVVPNEAWLRAARATRMPPARRFDGFADWQLEVLDQVLRPAARVGYETLGYELPGAKEA